MKSFISEFVADPKPVLENFRGAAPIFDHFGLESTIDDNLGRKVWLKSGGYLIVDQSEALTAIDVNTGRYVGKRDLEETVLKTNLEAVKEVVNQLRFRNIGGLIIIDLIDMEIAANREKVYRALQEALRQDKSRTNILKISELGLVEMTRKRTRENLVQMLCEPCAYCEGKGYVLSSESVAYKVLREIRKDLPRFSGREIAIVVSPRVAEVLLGPARKAQAKLAAELGREIEIRARPGLHQEQFEVIALDAGPPVSLSLSWLEEQSPEAPAKSKRGAKPGTPDPAEAPEAVSESQPETVAAAFGAAASAGPVDSEPVEDAAETAPEPDQGIGGASGAEAASGESADPRGDERILEGAGNSGGIVAPPAEPVRKLAVTGIGAGGEVLDVEAESPILPAPDEREEL
jgi:hypothetical protein